MKVERAKILVVKGNPYPPSALRRITRRLPNGVYVVEVFPASELRSVEQNRYYWGVVVEAFSQWSGYDKLEAHDVLKGMFLPEGKTSTSDLTEAEFAEYLERCIRFLSEKGVPV